MMTQSEMVMMMIIIIITVSEHIQSEGERKRGKKGVIPYSVHEFLQGSIKHQQKKIPGTKSWVEKEKEEEEEWEDILTHRAAYTNENLCTH